MLHSSLNELVSYFLQMWTGASPLLTKGPWAIYLGGKYQKPSYFFCGVYQIFDRLDESKHQYGNMTTRLNKLHTIEMRVKLSRSHLKAWGVRISRSCLDLLNCKGGIPFLVSRFKRCFSLDHSSKM